jgi:O-antigen/teichoic acid export membrane protein
MNPIIMSRLGQSLKRFLHNVAAGGLGQIINLCAQIVAVPLFLHYWSKPAYGEWLVLTSIPGLLWCFEGGLAGVASNRMTVAASAGNWPLANILFQNVLLAQSILCLLIFGGCVAFVNLTNVSQFFQLTHTTNREASGVLVLMIVYMIIGFFINLLRAVYRAYAREARGIMVTNLWRTVDLIVTVIVLVTHGHTLRLAASLVASAGLCLVFVYLDVFRKCPHVRFSVRETSLSQSRELMIDGAPLLISMAATSLVLQGYPLMVNRSLGASAVVNLTIIRTVSRTILQGIQLLSGSSAPELSRTYGRKDWENYLRLLKVIVAASFWGGLCSCVAMPLLGPWVIREWTGGKVVIDSLTLFLFGVAVALQGAWGICATVLVASNMHHLFNYLYFIFTVIALSVVPSFMFHLGFRGVPVVMMMADLGLLIIGIFLCYKKLRHISIRELGRVFQPSFYIQKAAGLRKRA